MITCGVELAAKYGVCRVCGRPIFHPPAPGVWWEEEDHWHLRRGEGFSSKNGAEFAHSACVAGEGEAPCQPA